MATTPVPATGSNAPVNATTQAASDIEADMLQVQTQRATILESQLTDQMKVVQGRNNDIGNLNAALAEIRKQRPSNDKDTSYANKGGLIFEMPTSMYASLADKTIFNSAKGADTVMVNATGVLAAYGISPPSSTMNQTQFDQLITTVTSKIDGLNSTQQLDMLRLQSLTNKRNEAFDIMTNFLKKMQDGRSNIINNLR